MTTLRHTASRAARRPRRARPSDSRRGVAMLLVIVALGTATILSTTFLSGRNNSGAIANNAADAVRARWSAKSAADIGVAVLQTALDWPTAIADGSLITNQPIAGADVSIDFTNLTGQLPTVDDRELVMTVRAVVGGVEKRTQRIIRLIPDSTISDALDLSLKEFSVFAINTLDADATGRFGVWDGSPEINGSIPAKIGLGFTSGSAYTVDPNAQLGKVGLYIPSDASPSLDAALLDDQLDEGAKLPIHIRTAPVLMPTIFDALPATPNTNISGAGVTQTLPPGDYQSLTIDNGAVVTLDAANGSAYSFGDLDIKNGSTLVFTGAVDVRVNNNFSVKKNSSIQPSNPASRLTIYAQSSVLVDDHVTIGFPSALVNLNLNPDNSIPYANPRGVRIFMAYAGGALQSIKLNNRAVVSGVIHAPDATALIDNHTVLFGSITVDTLTVKKNSAVFGDPTLDPGVGFTEPTSPLYTSAGAPVAGLVDGLAAINPALGVAANETNVETSIATALGGLAVALPSSIIGQLGGAPTPRDGRRTDERVWPMHVIAFELTHNTSGGGGGGGAGSIGTVGTVGGGGGGDGTFVNTQNLQNNTVSN